MGRELRDRTLGVIGLGGIARKLLELLAGWGMKPATGVLDPFTKPATPKNSA
jgi:phosphoglycerate dehydrogenase-like enzyme